MNFPAHYLKEELYERVKKDELIFDFIQSGSLDGLWYSDIENPGNVWLSPRYWEALGYDPATKKHTPEEWQKVIFPEDLQLAAQEIQKHCEDPNYTYDQVLRFKHQNGTTSWIRCCGIAIRDENGKAIRMLGSHTDITSLKRSEILYSQMLKRYESLLDSQSVYLVRINLNGVYTYANDFYCKSFGFDREQITYLHSLSAAFPEDRVSYEQAVMQCVHSPDVTSKATLRKVTPDGQVRWINWDFVCVLGTSGEIEEIQCTGFDITEQKEREEAFQRLSLVASQTTNGVIITDEHLVAQWANEGMTRLLGYLPDEIKGNSLQQLFKIARTDEAVASNITKRLSALESFNVDVLNHHKNGQPLWVNCNFSPLYGEKGNHIGFSIFKSDVTDRKLYEQALQESEQKHRTLFEIMRQGVVYHNNDGEIINANTAATEILGLSLEQMQGRVSMDPRWRAIKEDGSDFPGHEHPAAVALQTGQKVTDVVMGVYNVMEDAYRWMIVDAIPVYTPEDNTLHQVYASFVDITHLKKTEELLTESSEKYRLLVEHLNEGVWKIDSKGITTFVNSHMAAMLGYTVDEMLDKPLFDFIDHRYSALVREKIENEQNSQEAQYHIYFLRKDGSQVLGQVNVCPILNSDNQYQGSLAAIQDITERRKAEKELLFQQQQLEAIAQAQESFISEDTITDVFEVLLNNLLNVSNSEYGFISEVLYDEQEAPYLKTHALTNIAWDENTRKLYEENHKNGFEFRNLNTLFGAVLTEQKVVISNTPKSDPRSGGLPHGHPPMNSFIGIPFMVEGAMLGVVGLANRPGGYNHAFVQRIQPFVSTIGRLVSAKKQQQERQLIQEELIRTKEILEQTGQVAKVGGWEVDLTKGTVVWSKMLCKIHELDYDFKPTLDSSSSFCSDEETKSKLRQAFKKAVAEGTPFEMDFQIITSKGNVRWVKSIGKPDFVNGTCNRVYGTLQDIHEKKQAEEDLRKSQKKLELATNSTGVGVWDYWVKEDRLEWNDQVFELTGLDKSNFAHTLDSWTQCILPEAVPAIRQQLRNAFLEKREFEFEFPIRNNQGEVRHLAGKGVITRDSHGYPTRGVGIIYDLTQQLQTKKAEERASILGKISHNLPGVIYILKRHLDQSWTLLFISTSVEELFGYTATQMAENPGLFAKLAHPEDASYINNTINEAVLDGRHFDLEHRVITAKGEVKWLNNSAHVERQPDGSLVYHGHYMDITERKERENQIQEALDLVSDQNNRLLNFSYIVSHNIRSHASNILGIANILATVKNDEQTRNIFTQHLITSSRNLDDTLRQLNELLQIRSGMYSQTVTILLREAVKNAVDTVQMQINELDATVDIHVPEGMTIQYDKSYMESIILNLLTNALKYRHPERKPHITFRATEVNGKTVVEVADNGLGINLEKYGEKLFGMYKTFHGNEDARGIGLFITKNQIEAMGGRIEVDSVVDVGTTFLIYLK